jgi:hypothetical protein
MIAFALAPNAGLAWRAISIATGSGHYQLQAFPRSLLRLFFSAVFVPRVAPLHDYFPGRTLEFIGDLPRCRSSRAGDKGALAEDGELAADRELTAGIVMDAADLDNRFGEAYRPPAPVPKRMLSLGDGDLLAALPEICFRRSFIRLGTRKRPMGILNDPAVIKQVLSDATDAFPRAI